MGILKLNILKTSSKKKSEDLEEKIHLIQNGDSKLREIVIENYIPFIIKTLSNVLNRYIETENDPYFSIGLEAFNNSMDKYKEDSGSFINFAKTVITNRVYDEMRKEKRKNENEIKVDEERYNEISTSYAEDDLIHNKIEITLFKKLLDEYDISIDELVEDGPKHSDARMRAIKAGFTVAKNSIMINQLKNAKKIPRKSLSELSGLSEKIIKTNRSYIIAIALALDGDFPFIREYIENLGGDFNDEGQNY